MTPEEAFNEQLRTNPTDPLIRAVFGDWLQDQGDPRGPGYTAMGRLGLVPDMGADMPGYHDGTGTRRHTRRTPGVRIVVRELPASKKSALPRPWYVACWGDSEDDVALQWIMGPVLKTIEDNIALAFLRLPPDLQERYGVMGLR